MRQNVLRALQRFSAGSSGMPRLTGSLLEASVPARGLSVAGVCGFSTLPRLSAKLQEQASLATFAMPMAARSISTSSATGAEALTEVAVEGDAESLLAAIDDIVSKEDVTAKEVADAAVALTYLQAKSNRRLWGKVFEKASATKASFDAASLSSFLWAATTAGVGHFATIAELAGPAAALLKSFNPAQLSIVVEALGKAGVADAELYGKVADQVAAKPGDFKGADLARLLAGFGGAGIVDVRLAKVLSKELVGKAGELNLREVAQAVWGLAHLRRADKPLLDALGKAARSKLSSSESAVDAAALAWSLATLGAKPDAETVKGLAGALKAGAGELTPSHAAQGAWGLALLGGDKDAVSSLLSVAARAIDKDPASLDVHVLAAIHTAAVLSGGGGLSPAVSAYVQKVYGLAQDHAKTKRAGAGSAFRAELAQAVARAGGARYRPEITSAVSGFSRTAPDGSTVELALDLDNLKVAILAADATDLTSNAPHVALGPLLARGRVLETQGFKPVVIPSTEFAGLKDDKAKAAFVLSALKSAVPSAASKVATLSKKLDEPFDAYAE